MTLARATSLCLALSALSACSAPEAAGTHAAPWTVDAQPLVSIADSAAPAGHELNGVSSARRLPDHSILVANSGGFELTLFDSTGRFQRAIGRKGAGPGEFKGPIAMFAWRGDSIAVYDPAVQRWTVFDPALVATRTSPAPNPELLQPTWLYQGAVVNDGLLEPVGAWVVAALDSARRQDPKFKRLIRARRDDLGALWIRDSVDERSWTVYTDAGAPAGTVTLPAGLEPLQIGPDFVLGISYDSLGVEALRVHSLHRPDSRAVSPNAAPARLPTDSAMLKAFPALLMAQEMYYSTHAKYAPHADSLKLSAAFPGRFFLLVGDARHWSGVAVRAETGATCGLSVGWPSPLGWLDGTPFCGR